MEKTESEGNKLVELQVSSDIYMLAFAAQLNPCGPEPGSGYLDRKMCLLEDERTDIYICALKVAGTQIALAVCIATFFIYGNDGKGSKFTVPQSFFVILPRLTSSLMMHLNVVDDIEQGIAMMKYAVNHPQMFRSLSEEDDMAERSHLEDSVRKDMHQVDL